MTFSPSSKTTFFQFTPFPSRRKLLQNHFPHSSFLSCFPISLLQSPFKFSTPFPLIPSLSLFPSLWKFISTLTVDFESSTLQNVFHLHRFLFPTSRFAFRSIHDLQEQSRSRSHSPLHASFAPLDAEMQRDSERFHEAHSLSSFPASYVWMEQNKPHQHHALSHSQLHHAPQRSSRFIDGSYCRHGSQRLVCACGFLQEEFCQHNVVCVFERNLEEDLHSATPCRVHLQTSAVSVDDLHHSSTRIFCSPRQQTLCRTLQRSSVFRAARLLSLLLSSSLERWKRPPRKKRCSWVRLWAEGIRNSASEGRRGRQEKPSRQSF